MNPADAPEAAAPGAVRQRPIRSFVLRQGRLTPAQERAFAEHWARFGLELLGQPRDWTQVFGRRAPLVVEIGFGNGEALRWAAAHDPARDFVGIEVHRPGVGRLLNGLATDGSGNARVYEHDAVEVLAQDFAASSIDEVRIWFPDPWHKKRHNKRRLVQTAFIDRLATRLRPGGLLHLATDWAPYAQHMAEVMDAHPGFFNRAGPGVAVARPDWRTQTHFESRGQRLGHGVWDYLYERR